MDIQIDANTWLAQGIVDYLTKSGFHVHTHLVNPGGDGMDTIVIFTYESKKSIMDYLMMAGFVQSQFKIY